MLKAGRVELVLAYVSQFTVLHRLFSHPLHNALRSFTQYTTRVCFSFCVGTHYCCHLADVAIDAIRVFHTHGRGGGASNTSGPAALH